MQHDDALCTHTKCSRCLECSVDNVPPCTGRIFEFVHGSGANPPVITPANLPPIIETLLNAIKDEHHIAEKVLMCCSSAAA